MRGACHAVSSGSGASANETEPASPDRLRAPSTPSPASVSWPSPPPWMRLCIRATACLAGPVKIADEHPFVEAGVPGLDVLAREAGHQRLTAELQRRQRRGPDRDAGQPKPQQAREAPRPDLDLSIAAETGRFDLEDPEARRGLQAALLEHLAPPARRKREVREVERRPESEERPSRAAAQRHAHHDDRPDKQHAATELPHACGYTPTSLARIALVFVVAGCSLHAPGVAPPMVPQFCTVQPMMVCPPIRWIDVVSSAASPSGKDSAGRPKPPRI